MNLFFTNILLVLVTGHNVNPLHLVRRRHAMLKTADATPVDRSVSGLCSAAQDSVGVLISAAVAGITTLTQCAQYGRYSSPTGATYVSFSRTEDKCMWFADCTCLASSSTCLGGDTWASVAISDVIQSTSSAKIQTTPQTSSGNSAMVSGTTGKSTLSDPGSDLTDESYCDTSATDLMQHFQSACALSENMWFTRLVAGVVIACTLLVVLTAYGIAYKLDQDEVKMHR